jgi:hypothetical protein
MERQRRPSLTRRGCGLAVILVVFVASGCSSGGSPTTSTGADQPTGATVEPPSPEAEPIGTITISNDECMVDGISSPLPSGLIAVTVVNETDGRAIANFSMIFPSGTYERLAKHIAKEIELAERGRPGLGHPSYAPPAFDTLLEPGETRILSGELSPGTWAIVCGRTYDELEVDNLRPSGVFGPYEVE